MKIRYKKVIRDVTSDYSKNFMLVLAIAIGVFGIGAILGGYSVIKREMTNNYMGTTPASATIELEEAITTGLLDSVKQAIPGIKETERHATFVARMKVGDKWYPMLLFVVDDFDNMRTNKVRYLSGAREPSTGSMLAERTALMVMKAKEGDEVTIKTPHGTPHSLKISGTVHDAGLAPAWQEQAGYGYITLATLQSLGETPGFGQLRILVSQDGGSTASITKKANEVADWLTRNGLTIHAIQIPPPNKHPHQGQMNAVMTIFIVFSFMILILGSILVATSMATLMVKQVRQIGVMKTIGADTAQIVKLYLFMMLLLCISALVIAIPTSRMVAAMFYKQIATLLNLEIMDNSIPDWVPALQIATGILVPILLAAFPVWKGSRVSVRRAMDNYGVKNQSTSSWLYKLSQGKLLGETFMLSLRNVFRQRARLAMTLGLLAAGGAMFMTALNVSKAWDELLGRIYQQRWYDVDIKLNTLTNIESVLPPLETMEGVKRVEAWFYTSTSYIQNQTYEVARTYPDKGHGSFSIQALPVPTQLLNPTIVEGQWLSNSPANDVVLNQLARSLSPGIKIGDNVSLSVNGSPTHWRVIGFSEDVGSAATAYVSIDALATYTRTQGLTNVVRIAYTDRKVSFASAKTKQVEARLAANHVSILTSIPVWLLQNAIASHMKVLVNSLMAMALLMALVGTLGLMSTMSMNVMERTREIGVMRAIGATPARIRKIVMFEGLSIGSFSIFFAFLLSLVLSTIIGRLIGSMAFGIPLALAVSFIALSIWVAIIILGSYVATLLPARRASNMTTREALAYE